MASAGGPVEVRNGGVGDLPGVAAIYTHYVLNTTITFNTDVRTPAAWRDRYRRNVVEGPYDLLVAHRAGGDVVGYVETLQFRPKPAYVRSTELSIYVAPDEVGTGVGSQLLRTLLGRLRRSAFHRLFAIVTLPNEASMGFHRRHGFVHRGTLTEAGFKFGRYLDVAYLERHVGDAGGGETADGGGASNGDGRERDSTTTRETER